MTVFEVTPPFEFFTDASGKELESGYIYIGTPNLNAKTNQKAVYYDKDLTQPVAQPIRTVGGYPARGNKAAKLFISGDYSILVEDKNQNLIFSSPSTFKNTSNTTKTVDTISDLKALDASLLSNKDVYFVSGYYSSGDGGGGEFYWDSTSTQTDDGGITISLDSGSTGRFKRVWDWPLNVRWFGAKGDGVQDDTTYIQNALDAAKGDNATADNRYIFSAFIPLTEDGFYRITDTLVIDGTNGFHLFGESALTNRETSTTPKALLRWYGSSSKPVIQLFGQTTGISNPNFHIKIENLTITGYQSTLDPAGSMPSTLALSGIHIGALDGENENTLSRAITIDNCYIENCRFGIWSGNPDALNTDHAQVRINNCYLENNGQAGIRWGTGNAIVSVVGTTCFNNGWGAASFAADDYSDQLGANILVNSGSVDIVNYVSDGNDTYKPVDADIYQSSGRVSVINAWSDTTGFFFYQASASVNEGAYHTTQITGVRHYDSSMTVSNTPTSIRVVCPGMSITSCMLYGDIQIDSGLNGRPFIAGISFSNDAANKFKGTGVTTQRSLIHISNNPNYAQILMGGADSGVSMDHFGDFPPQLLSFGTATEGGGRVASLMQWNSGNYSAGVTGSGGSLLPNNMIDGSLEWLFNCYATSTGYTAYKADYPCQRMVMSTTEGLLVDIYDASAGTDFVSGDWVTIYRCKIPNSDGLREEALFQPSLRAADPGFTSGDFWEGCIYYNTTTNKLRVNTGGSTWVDLH